jgi:hypothetical protein
MNTTTPTATSLRFVSGIELRRLMEQRVSYARYAKETGNMPAAREHAGMALAYAAELDRRAGAVAA